MDQNQNRNQDPNNNKGPKNKQSLLVLLICIMVSLFGMNMLSRMTSNVSSEISYSEFIQLLDKGQVESVVINSDDLKVTLKNSGKLGNGTKTVIATEDENELTKRLDEANVEFKREKPNMAGCLLYTSETTRPLVVITAPGPGSGKMATCLSQLYHEHKRGVHAGYAKFETFPIWNIPLKHPVNLAYEAATADLNDVNMIDPFHLEAYGETTVNYNRDVEIFPVLRAIFDRCV